jgi:1-deoxy-D-xylulose-5-phosphate synthase
MASEGLKPVVAIYSTFLQRAFDQIVHDVCIEKLPVVFAIDRGGIVGEDGHTHQGLLYFAYLKSLPGMVIMAPKDENELRRMLKTAIDHHGPIALRYPRGFAEGVPMDDFIEPLPIGKGEVLSEGDDILVLAIGKSVSDAITACDQLRKEGITCTLINARFVKPLDQELITSHAAKTPRIITVEDHMRNGGFGSAVLECLADNGINGSTVVRLGIDDTFVEHGTQAELKEKYGINTDAIVRAAHRLMNRNG